MNPWIVGVVLALAAVGAGCIGWAVVKVFRTFVRIVTNIDRSLRDAVEIAKQYAPVVAAVQNLTAPTPKFGVETEEAPTPPRATSFPPPVWERFTPRTDEPEAEREGVDTVDLTPTEEELAGEEQAAELLRMSEESRGN